MSNGKKNYFRHDFNARNDDKVNDLIEKFGLSGYFYFFSLLELQATNCAGEFQDSVTYHQRTLIKELRLHKNKLRVFLEYSKSICILNYTYTENKVCVSMPNLSKYMGRYTIKSPPNTPNKKKRKEKKVNEIKTVETVKTTHEVNNGFGDSISPEANYIILRIKPEHQKTLLGKYDSDYLLETFFNTYNYYKENLTQIKFEKKIWISTINGWIKRDSKPVLKKMTQDELETKYNWMK